MTRQRGSSRRSYPARLRRRTILVGQWPGRGPSGRLEPLDGYSGRRIAGLMDIDHAELARLFERVNLLDREPRKGEAFDPREAVVRADILRERWHGRRVVFLGRLVAAAFRLNPKAYQYFETLELAPGFEAIVCPHPTGLNRWWADPENVERAREFFCSLDIVFSEFDERAEQDAHARARLPGERYTVRQMAAALRAGRGILHEAARILRTELGHRCTASTVHRYVMTYPVLAELVEEYRNRLVSAALSNVARAVEVDRDPNISLRVLERLSPDWAVRIKAEIGGALGLGAEAREALSGLSTEELRVLEGIYTKIEERAALPGPPPAGEP